jgi:hypothetical protein
MQRTILIKQPAGIGDIIFCQKLYKKLKSDNCEIFWPVLDQINWLCDYLDTVCTFEEIRDKTFDTVIDLEGQNTLSKVGGRIMESKYKYVNQSFDGYLDYFTPKRNHEKENELYSNLVKGKKYRLICDMFATPDVNKNVLKMNIPTSTVMDNIFVKILPNYTLFDWIKIIEDAEEIYCTDSAITFLVEKFNNKSKKLVCFSRRPHTKEIDYLYNKKWEFVV